jgi:hypothetical protein
VVISHAYVLQQPDMEFKGSSAWESQERVSVPVACYSTTWILSDIYTVYRATSTIASI